MGAFAEVGAEFGVGVGEREGDLGAQLAAVAAVQLVLDRRELADGRAVLSDSRIAARGAGEGGERVLETGRLGLPGVDR